MQKSLEANIWKYTLFLVAAKRIFVAILGAYYLTVPGVTPQIIGMFVLAGSLAVFIFEIPSGYASDKLGHKHALVISEALMVASTALFLFANSILQLICAVIFMGASWAFHSGAGSAFMHETLRALGREREYATVMGRASAIGFAVPAIFMILVPFLVSISYKLPFLIALFVDIIGLLTVLSFTVPPVSPEESSEIKLKNFRQVMQEGYRLNYFVIALFSGIVSGTFITVGGFRAAYQIFLGVPVIWYGVFFGTGRLLASLMLAYGTKIKERLTLPAFFKFQIALYTMLLFILGATSVPWIVVPVFIVSNAFQWGLSKVDESYQLDIIKSSKFKATLLSAGSQIDQAVAVVSALALGVMIEYLSYRQGFLYLGIIFALVLVPLYLYIAKRSALGVYKSAD